MILKISQYKQQNPIDQLNSDWILNESKMIKPISEGLMYHIQNNLSIGNSIYRIASDQWFSVINEVRELFINDILELSKDDQWFISTDLGKSDWYEGQKVMLDCPLSDSWHCEAVWNGREVELNKPKRGGKRKKYYVYTKNDNGKVIKVEFGDKIGGLSSKLQDPIARKQFAARHQCHLKNDKTKPGYWSCRLPRFAKLLGLAPVSAKWW